MHFVYLQIIGCQRRVVAGARFVMLFPARSGRVNCLVVRSVTPVHIVCLTQPVSAGKLDQSRVLCPGSLSPLADAPVLARTYFDTDHCIKITLYIAWINYVDVLFPGGVACRFERRQDWGAGGFYRLSPRRQPPGFLINFCWFTAL